MLHNLMSHWNLKLTIRMNRDTNSNELNVLAAKAPDIYSARKRLKYQLSLAIDFLLHTRQDNGLTSNDRSD